MNKEYREFCQKFWCTIIWWALKYRVNRLYQELRLWYLLDNTWESNYIDIVSNMMRIENIKESKMYWKMDLRRYTWDIAWEDYVDTVLHTIDYFYLKRNIHETNTHR